MRLKKRASKKLFYSLGAYALIHGLGRKLAIEPRFITLPLCLINVGQQPSEFRQRGYVEHQYTFFLARVAVGKSTVIGDASVIDKRINDNVLFFSVNTNVSAASGVAKS